MAITANCASILAQESAKPVRPHTLTLPEQIVVAIVVGAFVLLVLFAFKRLRDLRQQEQQADAVFEATVLRTIGSAPAAAHPPEPETMPVDEVFGQGSTLPDSTPRVAEPPRQQMPSVTGPAQGAADVVCADVIRQLQGAGLLEQVDGYIELNGNPRAAAVLRMRGGKRVLLVPHHETEQFTRHNLRRFDYLLYVGRDGKAVMVRSLEACITEMVGGSFGI